MNILSPPALLAALFLTNSTVSLATPVSAGLSLWRKPGRIQGGAACATCHSPDGIELATYNFHDPDILRRARSHLNEGDCQGILTYIHALRKKLDLAKLKDPILDRPLQPGKTVLPGLTPSDRDLAFGKELKDRLPIFFGSRIETFAQAQKAQRDLLALDPRTLRIGIPLNRLSEDVAHGSEHSSIAQWLPEVAPNIPKTSLASWYKAEDRYLAHPTQEQLRSLINEHQRLVDSSRQLALVAISTFKFRALLVLQDRIRHHSLAPQKLIADDVRGPGIPNSIWAVGDLARDFIGRDPNTLGMDAETQTKKLAGPTMQSQLSNLRVSWFWAGWLSDQGLFRTGGDNKTRLGLWMADSLSQDGPYPIHNAYSVARRQAVISNDPASWDAPANKRHRLWDFASFRVAHRDSYDMPKSLAQANLYRGFVSNCYRMSMLLLKHDIETTHEVWGKISATVTIKDMVGFIERADPQSVETTERLKTALLTLIESATDRH